jgi:hypothetical protein
LPEFDKSNEVCGESGVDFSQEMLSISSSPPFQSSVVGKKKDTLTSKVYLLLEQEVDGHGKLICYVCGHPNRGDCREKFPLRGDTKSVDTGNVKKHMKAMHESKTDRGQTYLITEKQKQTWDNMLLDIIVEDLEPFEISATILEYTLSKDHEKRS